MEMSDLNEFEDWETETDEKLISHVNSSVPQKKISFYVVSKAFMILLRYYKQ